MKNGKYASDRAELPESDNLSSRYSKFMNRPIPKMPAFSVLRHLHIPEKIHNPENISYICYVITCIWDLIHSLTLLVFIILTF